MARLEPCPACQRHVRVDEQTCPFCAVELGAALASLPARALPKSRLGRAALFAFGAAAVASTTVGCSDEPEPDDEGTNDAGARDGGLADGGLADGGVKDGGVQRDGGFDAGIFAPYGLPPIDSGFIREDANVAPVYGVPAWDSAVRDTGVQATDDGGFFPVYGLAPASEPDEKE